MNWYLVKMVYRIQCGISEHKAQFEEQLRLVFSDDANSALEKAKQIGINESSSNGAIGAVVHWKFINVSEIYQLNKMIDGAEIHSSLKEQENGALYEQITHKRAESLRQNIKHRILDIF